jgi:hypothetical protein
MSQHRRYQGYVTTPNVPYIPLVIPDNSINGAMIQSSAIEERHLKNGIVTQDKLSSSVLEWLQSLVELVTTDDLVDGCVTTPKLSLACVTSVKIAQETIEEINIMDKQISHRCLDVPCVDIDNLASKVVTNAKIADHAVDSLQIVSGSIDPVHLSAEAIALFAEASHNHSGVYAELGAISQINGTGTVEGPKNNGNGDQEFYAYAGVIEITTDKWVPYYTRTIA